MIRLKQKHSKDQKDKMPPADGRRIVQAQSVRRALIGGVGAAIVLSLLWAQLAMMSGKVYPWFSILAGALVGIAVQRFGKGLDWRFPVIALVLATVTAYMGNLMIGVLETGRYIDASPVSVLRGLSTDTFRNFFRNVIGPVDHIYAFSAAGVAAFFANRRLKRHEVVGLRQFQKDSARRC